MMTLANYGIGSSKHKDPNSAKALSKALQVRNRAETSLGQSLKSYHRLLEDKRNDILVSIKEYYSRVPFDKVIWNKYQTKQCIVDSILLLGPDFSPYKARDAFQTLESMLINLIHLPWHKEFRRIYTYSGLFKLVVSDPLIGIEEVLKAAGYRYESNHLDMHLILPGEKMPQTDDSESVTSVIFDCMLAQVVLSDMVDVFEDCCKFARQSTASEQLQNEVNCYSWIQSYFRERSEHTTDVACSRIQESLNNATNYLSKLELDRAKSTSSINDLRASSVLHQGGDTNKSINSNPIPGDNRDSPTISTQERTRRFLAQQSAEDEDSVKLSNDLLRLPRNINFSSRTDDHSAKRLPDNNSTSQRDTIRPSLEDQPVRRGSSRVNGFHAAQPMSESYQLTSGRQPHSISNEAYDSIDSHKSMTGNQHRTNLNRDTFPHPVRVDLPHNDREPLLSKHNRRFAPHQQSQFNRSNPGDGALLDTSNDIFNRHQQNYSAQHGIQSSSPSPMQRQSNHNHHYDTLYSDNISNSAQQGAFDKQQQYLGSSMSKYNDSSSHRRYDSRDSKPTTIHSSRLVWSCGSCTFNNQITSEICEMCRNKK